MNRSASPIAARWARSIVAAVAGSASAHNVETLFTDPASGIKVEKALLGDPELAHRAMCLGGANAAPPDDVGGAPGYDNFVAAMVDPKHPEHQQMLEWYGGLFDPTCFDAIALTLAYHDFKI